MSLACYLVELFETWLIIYVTSFLYAVGDYSTDTPGGVFLDNSRFYVSIMSMYNYGERRLFITLVNFRKWSYI